LCLSIAKGKGLVSIQELCNDRAGRYFETWRNHSRTSTTLFGICTAMGLKSHDYAREAFRLASREPSAAACIVPRDEFVTECIPRLQGHLEDGLSFAGRNRLTKHAEKFQEMLTKLYDQREIEIRGRMDRVSRSIFASPRPIRTERALDLYTEDLLGKPNWRWLVCVAETGEWLTKPPIADVINRRLERLRTEERPGGLRLVVADPTHRDRLEDTFSGAIKIRQIPWWRHNRHMTLFVNDEKLPFDAVFFTRRLRATGISPIRVKDEDAEVLLQTFVAYWNMADNNKQWDQAKVAETIANFQRDFLSR
jgi:hypothetical protein